MHCLSDSLKAAQQASARLLLYYIVNGLQLPRCSVRIISAQYGAALNTCSHDCFIHWMKLKGTFIKHSCIDCHGRLFLKRSNIFVCRADLPPKRRALQRYLDRPSPRLLRPISTQQIVFLDNTVRITQNITPYPQGDSEDFCSCARALVQSNLPFSVEKTIAPAFSDYRLLPTLMTAHGSTLISFLCRLLY